MFTPGALTSGFRTSGVIELGPLDEKYAIVGAADLRITVSLASICTLGSLANAPALNIHVIQNVHMDAIDIYPLIINHTWEIQPDNASF